MQLSLQDYAAVRLWPAALADARRIVADSGSVSLPSLAATGVFRAVKEWLRDVPSASRRAQEYHDLIGVLSAVVSIDQVVAIAHLLPDPASSLGVWEEHLRRITSEAVVAPGSAAASRGRPQAILCVEDQAVWQQAVREILTAYMPATLLEFASSVEEAHGAVRRTAGIDDAVVVLDLAIPAASGGISKREHGLQLLNWLRDEGIHWPTVVLSSPANSLEDHITATELGAADYLTKSSAFAAELLQAIRRATDEVPYRVAFAPGESAVTVSGLRAELEPLQTTMLRVMAQDGEARSADGWAVELWDNVSAGSHRGLDLTLVHLWQRALRSTDNDSAQALERLLDHPTILDILTNIGLPTDRKALLRSLRERYMPSPPPYDGDTFHNLMAGVQHRLSAEFRGQGLPFDWRRMVGKVTADTDEIEGPERTEYWLRGFSGERPSVHRRRRVFRVLVVDDDRLWRDAIQETLDNAHYDVRCVDFDECPAVLRIEHRTQSAARRESPGTVSRPDKRDSAPVLVKDHGCTEGPFTFEAKQAAKQLSHPLPRPGNVFSAWFLDKIAKADSMLSH